MTFNESSESKLCGVLPVISDISDHLPIFYVSRYEMKDTIPKYIKQMCRPITFDNINKFKLALGQTDWSIFENINDTNLAYNTFLTKFLVSIT